MSIWKNAELVSVPFFSMHTYYD